MCLHVRIATSRETLFAPIASERCGRGRGGLHGWIDDDHDGSAVRSVVGSKFTERGLSLAWLKSEVHCSRNKSCERAFETWATMGHSITPV